MSKWEALGGIKVEHSHLSFGVACAIRFAGGSGQRAAWHGSHTVANGNRRNLAF
jgi:hypothetical protein